MELQVKIKGQKDPLIFKGDRIDVLDFELNGVKYKQIRYFRKGFSKSEYIESSLVKSTREYNR